MSQKSESVAKLNEALSKAQTEFTVVPKNKTGREGNREFKYADLADVMSMALPKLNKYGIFLSQPLVLDSDNEHLRQTTRLELGDEFKQSDGIRISQTEGAGKQLGIEVTYARRIDLNGVLGIAPDEDLDAPDLKPGVPSSPPKPPFAKPINTLAQVAQAVKTTTVPVVKDPVVGFVATDEDLPDFNLPTKPLESTLAPDARATAIEMENFVPLTEERNSQIQNRLKELVASKTVGRRDLALYLEVKHENKKQFDVSANQWEATLKTIEDAVTEGPAAVKKLLKSVKE